MKHIPNISYTTKHDICTGCGICEGSCPSHAITMNVEQGYFRPVIDERLCKNGKGCYRCYDACPGIGLNLVELANSLFAGNEFNKNEFVGNYLKCFTGHSNDYEIRYHCASGGMVSQFLIWLIEHGKIDGAIVTAFDKDAPMMVRSYIATTREEVLAAKSSKYSPVTLNHAINDIKNASGERYIVVGLPCHIEGFRKYEARDSHFKKKIAGYFAIYCSSGRSFYMTDYILQKLKIPKGDLLSFAYRDEGCLGSMVVKWAEKDVRTVNNNTESLYKEYRDRFQDYYHPLRSIFVPQRCTLCIDHYGELADVSFGDIHVHQYKEDKIGVNSFIVRNKKFLDWLKEAQKAGVITMKEIDVEIVNMSQPMASVKKYRNSAFIKFRRALGKKVPQYDNLAIKVNYCNWILSFIHTTIQQFIGQHKSLWFLIPVIKGKSPSE